LDEIHKKISSSAALNGGFDTLLFKIDKIEQSQGQLVSKVDKIHEAIYDPKEGIVSQLADHKLESTVRLNEIKTDIAALDSWKKNHEKDDIKDEKVVTEASSKVANLEKSVETLVRHKNNAAGILKWFAVAIGGGIITLIFGWLESKLK
jgi:hypothetical protein